MLKLALISLSIFTLTGCSPQPSEIYHEYQNRLSTALNSTTPDIPDSRSLHHPNVTRPTSTLSISIIELASINHCRLSQTIAKRNNQLGKVQLPSEALKYSVQFVQQANECINSGQTNNPLIKDKLLEARREKQHQLNLFFEHMLFSERELKQFTHLAATEVSFDRHSELQNQTLEALAQLVQLKQLLSQKDKIENLEATEITTVLKKLHKNAFVQRVITSARQQVLLNQATSAWLHTVDIENTVCPSGKNKQKAHILNNIFSKYYLGQLQGYQAQLTSMLQKVSPFLAALWQNHPELVQWVDENNPQYLLTQLKSSAISHVKWWQTFYKTCKIRPQ
ncbi:DUF3080 family protein [Pseudoalteromonas sp. MMG005]|uniref:DUF3080 family protein n=1 Tax=Pseudoalteromonas sp. MMG005 TaxID=2822682 RepID=UPI001B39E43A|nr:DUF3080 family protein [Pseudoalteromonas sp. MMG005]MBQ4845549.1 DUF3080 family protein [Pseudoalteromonas sp. MMG005]